jgi:hypothetical protein
LKVTIRRNAPPIINCVVSRFPLGTYSANPNF